MSTIIEVEPEGRSFPLARVLRAVNKRSLRELHEEIRSIQASPAGSQGLK